MKKVGTDTRCVYKDCKDKDTCKRCVDFLGADKMLGLFTLISTTKNGTTYPCEFYMPRGDYEKKN